MPPPTRFRMTQPLREFLHAETSSSFVLLGAAIVAMLWANTLGSSYLDFWHQEVTVGQGRLAITEDLTHWVNDLLMALFFFVVGLEIKRELVDGELRNRRAATLPAIAALGGVLAPALIFVLIAPPEARAGWGIPIATDIAFAVGVLALAGNRVSAGAKLLMLSIAIVDDIMAILVIAVFYTEELNLRWLALAVVPLVAMPLMRRWVPWSAAYLVPGGLLWLCLFESGVHATLAGVICGLLTPTGEVRGGRRPLDSLLHHLHPISAFVVLPVFALANAGLDLRGGVLGETLSTALPWAVAIALVVGKTVGISLASLLAIRLRLGELPSDMRLRELGPLAVIGGIGFTVSMFVADLSFEDETLANAAKVGVYIGSVAAAVLGLAWLSQVGARSEEPGDDGPSADDQQPENEQDAPARGERPR